jgi:hypothetical protein
VGFDVSLARKARQSVSNGLMSAVISFNETSVLFSVWQNACYVRDELFQNFAGLPSVLRSSRSRTTDINQRSQVLKVFAGKLPTHEPHFFCRPEWMFVV